MNFALTYSRLVSDSFSIKKEARAVATKKWVKANSGNLRHYADLLRTNGYHKRIVIRTAIYFGYGANIGEQIFNLLSEQAIEKIADNIKAIC